MATAYTTSSAGFTDEDWGNNANWTVAEPVNGNEAQVYGTDTNITAGLDNNTVVLDELAFESTYSGQIGSLNNPLQIDSTILWFYGSSASNWMDGAYGTFYMHSLNMGTNNFHLNTEIVHTTGLAIVTAGNLTSGAKSTITLLVMDGIDSRLSVTGAVSSTTTTLQHHSGLFTSNAAVTTHNQTGGTTAHVAGTTATVNIYGGTYVLKAGTVTTLNLFSGSKLDLTQVIGTGVTITNLNLYGGDIIAPEKMAWAATSTKTYRGRGLSEAQGQSVVLQT